MDAGWAVCGHTHLVDQRTVAGPRLVNAGSVGKPFDGAPTWLLIDAAGVQVRRTGYDTAAAVEAAWRELGSSAPGRAVAQDFADSLAPPGRQAVLEVFAPAAVAQRGHLAPRSRLAALDR